MVAANRQADAGLKQAEPERRNHVAELFNPAVGQLDDDRLHVRLGAVHTLIEIEADFPDLTHAIYELLLVYARERGMSVTTAGADGELIFEWVRARKRRRRR